MFSAPSKQSTQNNCQLTQQMLPMLRELYQASGGDLTMMLVLLEVWTHAHCHCKQADGTPRATNGHSIALVTGIPRETVRRKLIKLTAQGWLTETSHGQLLPTPQLAEQLSALRSHCRALLAPNK